MLHEQLFTGVYATANAVTSYLQLNAPSLIQFISDKTELKAPLRSSVLIVIARRWAIVNKYFKHRKAKSFHENIITLCREPLL